MYVKHFINWCYQQKDKPLFNCLIVMLYGEAGMVSTTQERLIFSKIIHGDDPKDATKRDELIQKLEAIPYKHLQQKIKDKKFDGLLPDQRQGAVTAFIAGLESKVLEPILKELLDTIEGSLDSNMSAELAGKTEYMLKTSGQKRRDDTVDADLTEDPSSKDLIGDYEEIEAKDEDGVMRRKKVKKQFYIRENGDKAEYKPDDKERPQNVVFVEYSHLNILKVLNKICVGLVLEGIVKEEREEIKKEVGDPKQQIPKELVSTALTIQEFRNLYQQSDAKPIPKLVLALFEALRLTPDSTVQIKLGAAQHRGGVAPAAQLVDVLTAKIADLLQSKPNSKKQDRHENIINCLLDNLIFVPDLNRLVRQQVVMNLNHSKNYQLTMNVCEELARVTPAKEDAKLSYEDEKITLEEKVNNLLQEEDEQPAVEKEKKPNKKDKLAKIANLDEKIATYEKFLQEKIDNLIAEINDFESIAEIKLASLNVNAIPELRRAEYYLHIVDAQLKQLKYLLNEQYSFQAHKAHVSYSGNQVPRIEILIEEDVRAYIEEVRSKITSVRNRSTVSGSMRENEIAEHFTLQKYQIADSDDATVKYTAQALLEDIMVAHVKSGDGHYNVDQFNAIRNKINELEKARLALEIKKAELEHARMQVHNLRVANETLVNEIKVLEDALKIGQKTTEDANKRERFARARSLGSVFIKPEISQQALEAVLLESKEVVEGVAKKQQDLANKNGQLEANGPKLAVMESALQQQEKEVAQASNTDTILVDILKQKFDASVLDPKGLLKKKQSLIRQRELIEVILDFNKKQVERKAQANPTLADKAAFQLDKAKLQALTLRLAILQKSSIVGPNFIEVQKLQRHLFLKKEEIEALEWQLLIENKKEDVAQQEKLQRAAKMTQDELIRVDAGLREFKDDEVPFSNEVSAEFAQLSVNADGEIAECNQHLTDAVISSVHATIVTLGGPASASVAATRMVCAFVEDLYDFAAGFCGYQSVATKSAELKPVADKAIVEKRASEQNALVVKAPEQKSEIHEELMGEKGLIAAIYETIKKDPHFATYEEGKGCQLPLRTPKFAQFIEQELRGVYFNAEKSIILPQNGQKRYVLATIVDIILNYTDEKEHKRSAFVDFTGQDKEKIRDNIVDQMIGKKISITKPNAEQERIRALLGNTAREQKKGKNEEATGIIGKLSAKIKPVEKVAVAPTPVVMAVKPPEIVKPIVVVKPKVPVAAEVIPPPPAEMKRELSISQFRVSMKELLGEEPESFNRRVTRGKTLTQHSSRHSQQTTIQKKRAEREQLVRTQPIRHTSGGVASTPAIIPQGDDAIVIDVVKKIIEFMVKTYEPYSQNVDNIEKNKVTIIKNLIDNFGVTPNSGITRRDISLGKAYYLIDKVQDVLMFFCDDRISIKMKGEAVQIVSKFRIDLPVAYKGSLDINNCLIRAAVILSDPNRKSLFNTMQLSFVPNVAPIAPVAYTAQQLMLPPPKKGQAEAKRPGLSNASGVPSAAPVNVHKG